MNLSPKAQASLDKVVAKFQQGDLSPITQAIRFRLPDGAPANGWTFNNRVLAFAQTGSLDCRGFKQWQAIGRKVNKGETSAYILRPHIIKKEKENGEPEQRLIGFKPIAVFGAEQTEGEPLPDYTPQALPPLYEVAQKLNIEVQYKPLPADRNGDCDRAGSQIRLGTADERTWFHELAHAAHARIDGTLKGGQAAGQETIAEFTACVLMDLYGSRDSSGKAWRYIAGYNKDPLKAVMKALDKVGRVIEFLLGAAEAEAVAAAD